MGKDYVSRAFDILEELLGDRRIRESATFSTRTYSDQPIIQTGRQLRERMERDREHAEQGVRASASRESAARSRGRSGATRTRGHDKAPRTKDATSQQARLPLDIPAQNVRSQATAPGASARVVTVQPQRIGPVHSPRTDQVAERTSPVPSRYYELRDLAESWGIPSSVSTRGSLSYGSRAANHLFYEQARFMADFEDDYEFSGTFHQYFPTYSSMTLSQLRGYFSWRTKVRAGNVMPAPLSFAFLYVYELLMGVGTAPGEQGLADLLAFKRAFEATGCVDSSSFSAYVTRWAHDYIIYHGLDPALLPRTGDDMRESLHVLLRAEATTLARNKRARKVKGLEDAEDPSDEELFQAISTCSSYEIKGARLYKTNPADVCSVACETFRALVLHCSRRRATDFVEGLFGAPLVEPYTMYASAVFFDPRPHADVVMPFGPLETYECVKGRWRRALLCKVHSRSTELGLIMHAVDQRLRERLDYPYPLKARPVSAYVTKIIDKAIDALLERKAEEERRSIHIDLSRLANIRAAAAMTQEALLTDDERAETPTAEPEEPTLGPTASASPASSHATAATPEPPREHHAEQPAGATSAVGEQVATEAGDGPLSPDEHAVVMALLAGAPLPNDAGGQMMSLVIDSINEKLFDLVGDAVIEYDDDTATLIEDYVEDVREIVGA